MRWLTGQDWEDYLEVMRLGAYNAARALTLESENEYLRKQAGKLEGEIAYHRERADRAVDDMLWAKGYTPIMPEARHEVSSTPFVEDPTEVAAIRKRIEQDGWAAVIEESVMERPA